MAVVHTSDAGKSQTDMNELSPVKYKRPLAWEVELANYWAKVCSGHKMTIVTNV